MPIRFLRSRTALFAAAIVLFHVLTSVQPGHAGQGPEKRPKVGLVLSGGGARGLAHIGVLEWFEKNRIPVDYLTGTSMGGLVGGMYAMGMTPAEMRAFLRSIDWQEAFSSGPSYEALSYRRREDRRNYPVGIELGLRHGFSMPTGLSTAHYIGLIIDRLTLPYSTIGSFDELPIPYRCMATDFLTAKALILKDGSLSSAMRATMSIPGVFPPVERDGKILVDGGLLNNIPTDAMRQMGPDVVIAVDIGTPLGDIKTIQSLGGIFRQTSLVTTIDNDRRNLRLADIIIAPALADQSLLDFSAIDKVAEIGFRGAEDKAVILQKFALDEAAWQQHMADRNLRKKTNLPLPVDIRVTGISSSIGQADVRERLKGFVGRPLDTKEVETALSKMTGQGKYESVDYGFEPSAESPGGSVLAIRVKEKSYAPPTVNALIELQGSDVDEIIFAFGVRQTIYDLGGYGSEWRNDIRLGNRSVLASEYFRPIGRKGFFVAPSASFQRGEESYYASGAELARYQINRIGGAFDIGFLTHRTELRLGYEIGHINADLKTGTDAPPTLNGMTSAPHLRWTYDGQDSATVPSRGFRFRAEARWVLDSPNGTHAFPQAEIRGSQFVPVSSRGSILFAGSMGTTFNENASIVYTFPLGGPYRLGAYDRDEFRGNHYLLGSFGYRHEISRLPPLFGGKVFAIGWYDAGGTFMDFDDARVRHQGSAGLIMDTKFGPFSLIGAYGEYGRGKIYFAFGKFF